MYLIYARIPSMVYEDKMKYLVATKDFQLQDEYYIGLYAWTNKKRLKNRFLKYRNHTHYLVKDIDCTDEEIAALEDIYHNAKIGEYDFSTGKVLEKEDEEEKQSIIHVDIRSKEKLRLATTKQEWVESSMNGQENYCEFVEPKMKLFDYRIFNDHIIQLLDRISYTTNLLIGNYDVVLGPEPFSSDNYFMERVIDYAAYGQTLYGNQLFEIHPDDVTLFTRLYRELLV